MQICVDAGNEDTPILYPCHQPKAQEKQRFRVLSMPGWVQMQKSWADNGRKRLFEKCIDHAPEPLVQVVLDECDVAQQRGVSWTRMGIRTPRETQLWSRRQLNRQAMLGLVVVQRRLDSRTVHASRPAFTCVGLIAPCIAEAKPT